MKKTIIISVFMACVSAFMACTGSEDKGASQDPTSPTSLTQEQRDAAAQRGWAAARAIINAHDTLEMQAKLLDARVAQSEYVTAKRPAEAEVFDTAFIHTLRAVRPDIARELEQQ